MSKQNDTARRNAIASAISDAMTTNKTIGATLVTQCVTVCNKFFRGKPIEKDEREAICDRLAEIRGWSDTSAKSRKSEVRPLLEHYNMLPELVKEFRDKGDGGCTWHNVVQLAREVGKHSGKTRVRAAVTALLKRGSASATPPNQLSRKEAKGRIASSVKTILKMTRVEANFRNALEELCEQYRINV